MLFNVILSLVYHCLPSFEKTLQGCYTTEEREKKQRKRNYYKKGHRKYALPSLFTTVILSYSFNGISN